MAFLLVGSIGLLYVAAIVGEKQRVWSASQTISLGEARGALSAKGRAGAEQVLTRLWDENAVGKTMESEIAAVKRQFMQQQLDAHTTNFGLRTTALQSANATAGGNATANATDVNSTDATSKGYVFDNQWFANWCELFHLSADVCSYEDYFITEYRCKQDS